MNFLWYFNRLLTNKIFPLGRVYPLLHSHYGTSYTYFDVICLGLKWFVYLHRIDLLNDPVRQRNTAHQSRRGDAPQLPGLRHERDCRPGAPGRTGRLKACAPPGLVRHARVEQRLEPAI